MKINSLLSSYRFTCLVLNLAALIVVVGMALSTTLPVRAAGPAPELMYYKFDNAGGTSVLNEASAPVGTNPAPLLGSLTMGGAGICGSALIGTGGSSSTDYVNTGWATNLGSGSWTISFWINNLPDTTTTYYMFGDITAGQLRAFTGGVAGSGNIILRGQSTQFTDVLVTGVTSAQPAVIDFVYDSTGMEIRAYLNGALVKTVAQPSLNIGGTGPFKIGGYSSNNSLPNGTLLDEFKIYNRALSPSEIALNSGCPEIEVQGNGQAIADGNTSPSSFDDTDFGSIALDGAITRTFTISNSGTGPLTLTGSPLVSLTGPAAGDFSVVSPPTTPIISNTTTTFQVRFDPSIVGTRAATITIANDDSDENPYDFAIQGEGSNTAPVANAGPDQNVASDTPVTLNGSGSSDPDGHTPLTFGWTQTGGPDVTLSDPTASQTTFTAPGVSTVLTFSLTVTDSFGLADPTPDEVMVTVNQAPIANAGPDQSVASDTPVTLSGSGSSDPDGHTPLTFGWTQTGGPDVTLSDPTASQSTFTAPGVSTVLTFSLTVTDSFGLADPTPAEVVVTVTAPEMAVMYVANYNNNTISRANLDGTGGVSLGNLNGTLNTPFAIALDVAAGKMYVVNIGNTTISRANLDGTDGVNLGNLNGTLSSPYGLALDVAAGKMYVVNIGNTTVSRANLDGTGGVSLGNLNGTLSDPISIALDVAAGKMYVMNFNNKTISRANLDGTGGVSLGNLGGTLSSPYGLALDVAAGKMYVVNIGNTTVSRANLDGTGGVNLGNLNGTLSSPYGLALDVTAGKMYVTNYNNTTISRANLDGTGGVSLGNLNGTLSGPISIALGPAPAVPEMAVMGNKVEIADGDATPAAADHTDFGSVSLGGAITRTFTISNSGGANLSLTGSPVVSITGAAGDFSLVSQPATPIGAGNTTTFQVRFNPSVIGTRAVTITLANTDSKKNPYNFVLHGMGASASQKVYLPFVLE